MVGDKIREIRTRQNITSSELATRIGVSRSYLSQLERNTIDPSVSVLKKIASALHVSVSSFFDDTFEDPAVIKGKTPNEMHLSKEGISYQHLSPDEHSPESLVMLSFSIPAGIASDMQKNRSDLCIYVLDGVLCVCLEETEHTLYTGDSLYLRREVSYCLSAPDIPVSGIICMKRHTK